MNVSDIEKEFINAFRRALPTVEIRVAAEVITLLSRLRVKDGAILPTEFNYVVAQEIREALGGIIYESGYLDLISGYAEGLAKVKAAQDAVFAQLGVTGMSDFQAVYNNSARLAIDTLSNGAVSVQQQEFANLMNSAIGSSSNFADTVTAVRQNIAGTDEFKGRLEAYAGTYAKDAATVTNATYLDAVSTANGLDWFRYVGAILDDDSREFCIERVGKTFHRREIELWGEGVNTGLKYPEAGMWPGMNRATTAKSIFALRGGYNCAHNFIPVSIDAVPEDKLQEAKDKGWF